MGRSLHLSANEKAVVLALRASRRSSAVAPTAAPAVPVIESKPRFECVTPDCYKFGHKFSQTGAFGVPGVAKGHFELNPTHTAKAV